MLYMQPGSYVVTTQHSNCAQSQFQEIPGQKIALSFEKYLLATDEPVQRTLNMVGYMPKLMIWENWKRTTFQFRWYIISLRFALDPATPGKDGPVCA
jgi:hypothetical protein